MQVNKAIGMVSLNDALLELVAKKLVAPDEAYAKSVDKAGFESLLKRLGIDPKALAPQGYTVVVLAFRPAESIRIVRRRFLRIARSAGTRGAHPDTHPRDPSA